MLEYGINKIKLDKIIQSLSTKGIPFTSKHFIDKYLEAVELMKDDKPFHHDDNGDDDEPLKE